MSEFEMSRAAGLRRLEAFLPRTGRAYAAGRNAEPAPGELGATSVLSPWVRRRLLTEEEIVAAVLERHAPSSVEKFVGEVFWRTYFKGFLETHPTVWEGYRAAVAEAEAAGDVAAAMAGRTGIDCFDDWARELVETGWLHNHVRMWFASIWIFTLGLPWALGADFFARRLMDFDPASNTLNWRWVAGLHTKGRAYAARAENIARYTGGRYAPSGLNERPVPITEEAVHRLRAVPAAGVAPAAEVALLLHLDDLHPESWPLEGAVVRRVAGLVAHTEGAAERVREADRAAMADGLARASARFGCEAVAFGDGWADGLPVVTAWAPVGPSADALPACVQVRRVWDQKAWPHATRGYFGLRAAIPELLSAVQGPGPWRDRAATRTGGRSPATSPG